MSLKLHTSNQNVLIAEDKFGLGREIDSAPRNIEQLGELAIKLLNDKHLQISQVKPFFWSMVEVYADRFQTYPFDVERAMISYLELKDFPEDLTLKLVNKLESEFESTHGRPLRQSTQPSSQEDELDDEIKALRNSLKYAAMVAESSD